MIASGRQYSPFRDVRFNVALLLGPLFWTGWFFFSQPVLKLSWVIRHPDKFFILAVMFPVLEEIVFRGWIQSAFSRISKGARLTPALSVSNLLTSLVFSLFHLFFHSVFWSLMVMIPSLIFGYFKERHGYLLPCIILHIFYNAGYFLLFSFF